jgi:hypothetical protein
MSEDCEVGVFANVRGRFRVYGFGAKREAMVGGSQGVRKVLIYSGFNILLFFLHMPKGFYSISPYFEIGVGKVYEQPVL